LNYTINNKPMSVALGTFDGLHTGHQKVIENAVSCADGLTPVILLFKEHPLAVLKGKAPKRLITQSQELSLLEGFKITPVYIDFCSVMNLTSEDFITRIARELNVRQISCGFNYRFGKNAAGNTEILKQLCDDNGIRLSVAPAVMFDGLPVSSSRIRESVKAGDMSNARQMLGRYFSYDFTVVTGRMFGREIGFPTINQVFTGDFIIPKYGVYASYTLVKGSVYPSVTNVGIRPTIGDNMLFSETHIIGVDDNLYGENIQVSLIKRLRSETAFETTDALRNQILKDKKNAMEIWESINEPID